MLFSVVQRLVGQLEHNHPTLNHRHIDPPSQRLRITKEHHADDEGPRAGDACDAVLRLLRELEAQRQSDLEQTGECEIQPSQSAPSASRRKRTANRPRHSAGTKIHSRM